MPRKTKEPTVDDMVREQIGEMSDTTLYCRDSSLRHQWTVTVNFVVTKVGQVGQGIEFFRRQTECARGCGVIATELYQYTKRQKKLERISRNLDYSNAPGYLLTGVGRQAGLSGLVHYEQFRRAMVAQGQPDNVINIARSS